MPVQFLIEPGMPTDINTVTISNTFFELGNDNTASLGINADQL
jgi:cytochrome c oxidase assembly protein subunit 11